MNPDDLLNAQRQGSGRNPNLTNPPRPNVMLSPTISSAGAPMQGPPRPNVFLSPTMQSQQRSQGVLLSPTMQSQQRSQGVLLSPTMQSHPPPAAGNYSLSPTTRQYRRDSTSGPPGPTHLVIPGIHAGTSTTGGGMRETSPILVSPLMKSQGSVSRRINVSPQLSTLDPSGTARTVPDIQIMGGSLYDQHQHKGPLDLEQGQVPGQGISRVPDSKDRDSKPHTRREASVLRVQFVLFFVTICISMLILLRTFRQGHLRVAGRSRNSFDTTDNDRATELLTGGGILWADHGEGLVDRDRFSVILACSDHADKLSVIMQPLIELQDLGEIIVVDVTSKQSLVSKARNVHPKVVYLRIQNSGAMASAAALNLGAHLASYDNLMFVDCDIALAPLFTEIYYPKYNASSSLVPRSSSEESEASDAADMNGNRTALPHYTLSSGWWAHSTKNYASEDKWDPENPTLDLSAVIVLPRFVFWDVKGYDTRLRDRSSSQADLEVRLQNLDRVNYTVTVKQDVSKEDAFRIFLVSEFNVPHQKKIEFFNKLNHFAIQRLKSSSHISWSRLASMEPVYTIRKLGKNDYVAERKQEDAVLSDPAASFIRDRQNQLVQDAVVVELHDKYEIPLVLLDPMTDRQRQSLKTRLAEKQQSMDAGQTPRVLVAHLMHGMGNRLRALGSAMTFAQRTNRVLIIVWPMDFHLDAKMEDLFDIENIEENAFVVINQLALSWSDLVVQGLSQDKAWSSFRLYNYMEIEGNGAVKDEPFAIDDAATLRSVYFKSAYIIKAPGEYTNWNSDSRNIRSLKPSAFVSNVMKEAEDAAGTSLANLVGVHVRNLPLNVDITNVSHDREYSEKDQVEMDFWRAKANPQAFIDEMKQIDADNPGIVFFVSTDSEDSFQMIKNAFPPKQVVSIPKQGCDSRTRVKGCIALALADAMCLGRTRLLLGSNWSSFTELAQRLGVKRTRLAGVDFGDLSKDMSAIAKMHGLES